MHTILTQHALRYPAWTAADVYKLIHQAACGSEHALGAEADVRDRLMLELATCGVDLPEPLIDPISPDGQIVRVHLRPFHRMHLDPDALLRAFVETARGYRPGVERLHAFMSVAQEWSRAGALGLSVDQVEQQLAAMQASGFPAVHHSGPYVQHYRPAYRVVSRDFLTGEIAAAA